MVWDVPVVDGGLPVSMYQVILLKGDQELSTSNTTETTFTATGLFPYTDYRFKVTYTRTV